ncbi:hypothetical protein PITCH_A350040 [uncultured Desulfobacterium sp.]|uniref:Uncharacterized protein n=1 Tax=uncultured Desulfobacterium sp. TaxID=201089 RepID=A0A445MZQ8_9BACT|nr:hypothetical protein PITCH_A350040 [uncultured Desulfobacterium sp.]
MDRNTILLETLGIYVRHIVGDSADFLFMGRQTGKTKAKGIYHVKLLQGPT